MNINRVDLNLLVYLDALLRERNVTQAANQLNLSQPAMSNGLRRLRELFDDPLLVRTSDGMTPTERALELEPNSAADAAYSNGYDKLYDWRWKKTFPWSLRCSVIRLFSDFERIY